MENSAALPAPFHPLIVEWFLGRYGEPTEIQQLSWPVIAAGNHALVTAPTGSGKTLTAFLWAVNELVTGAWPCGELAVLYVSPLKALGNDVRRNLTEPLTELEELFRRRGKAFPEIMVRTRTGDTPQSQRRAMLRRRPEILITTPESLAILLTSRGGRELFGSLKTCILDEIHSVVGSKRGVFLISQVERIAAEWGEFQRLALTATVRPAETVANFIAGYRLEGDPEEPVYRRREITLCRAAGAKEYRLRILTPEGEDEESFPGGADTFGGAAAAPGADPGRPEGGGEQTAPAGGADADHLWRRIARRINGLITSRRSTLIFANSRRLVEKLARLINEEAGGRIAYAHHGSLSRELRLSVEERLKSGELKAITATNSLELGIDVGALDLVIMVQTPFTVSSGIQKLGRAGHRVGSVSEGALFPSHGLDYVKAAVMRQMIIDGDLEEVRPVEAPLDVLAQLILSMTSVRSWRLERLYRRIRTAEPFHRLERRHFDLVAEMLAGKYAGTRIRELQPRISIDRTEGTAAARKGTPLLLYLSGGTIPDRGQYNMRLAESKGRVGELDEEFVWERKVGDRFELGTQTWEITEITHNDVFVRPTGAPPNIIPFWRAEERNRDAHFSEGILAFLDRFEARASAVFDNGNSGAGTSEERLVKELEKEYCMERPAARRLTDFLRRQREASGAPLPGRRRVVAEHVDRPFGPEGLRQVVLHTLRGGTVNRPLALLLEAYWERRRGSAPQIIAGNDAVVIALEEEEPLASVLTALADQPTEELLRSTLERTGLFGALFRENAGRSLLLPRQSFNKRLPLWFNRLRSKKLLQAVFDLEDFPVLLETWRSCLRDVFDLNALGRFLEELSAGEIEVLEPHTAAPSPLCSGAVWRQVNVLMYADDTPERGSPSGLDHDLWSSVLDTPEFRPQLPAELCRSFEAKLQRLLPGYTPADPPEILEWVKERLLMPQEEWQRLAAGARREGGPTESELIGEIGGKLRRLIIPDCAEPFICAADHLPLLLPHLPEGSKQETVTARGRGGEPVEEAEAAGDLQHGEPEAPPEAADRNSLAAWILRFYGPLDAGRAGELLPFTAEAREAALEELIETGSLIRGELTETAERPELCDRENLETLLRMRRSAARTSFEPLPTEALTPFLARMQGILPRGAGPEELHERLCRLIGLAVPAEALEERLIPARMERYYRGWLDGLADEEELRWYGAGRRRILLSYPEELDLYLPEPPAEAGASPAAETASRSGQRKEATLEALRRLFPSLQGKFSFFDIKEHTGLDAAETVERLWELVWSGAAACDSFSALRSGIAAGFKAEGEASGTTSHGYASPNLPSAGTGGGLSRPRRRGSRSSFRRWRASLPLGGNWYALRGDGSKEGGSDGDYSDDEAAGSLYSGGGSSGGAGDPFEEEERNRDRVRQLLSRYGILARPLLSRELPPLQWRPLLRTIQRMELAGEVTAGHFISGLPGLQFASPEALELLRREREHPDTGAVYWMNAADPASPCGLGLEGLSFDLPDRSNSAYIVFRGRVPVLYLLRSGRELRFPVEPGDGEIPAYLQVFDDLCGRDVNPRRRIVVETINGEPASRSRFRADLEQAGFSASYRGLVFRPRPGV